MWRGVRLRLLNAATLLGHALPGGLRVAEKAEPFLRLAQKPDTGEQPYSASMGRALRLGRLEPRGCEPGRLTVELRV